MKLRYYVVYNTNTDEKIGTLQKGDFDLAYIKALYYPNFKAGRWKVTKII